jgi:hypothetical protein
MIIDGLDDQEQETLTDLWSVWTRKLRRNMIRAQYYDHKNVLKDLGIAIPPELTSIELVLGWPAKSVDVLARRCKLEGFTTPGVNVDPLGITELWRDNDLDVEWPQVITSALLHSCAFVSVTEGDTSAGEPAVLISSQSALYGAGVWDARLRRLKSALSIVEFDGMGLGLIQQFVFFMPGKTVRCVRTDNVWDIQRMVHSLDRLPVEVIAYKPRLDRPFGSSRISRTVMGLTDSALRTLFRMEVSAEFYSAPQRYIMGADEKMFVDEAGNPKSQWQAIMGRVWAAPAVEDSGQLPAVGEFHAASQQPHIEQLRSLASVFASEASLPLSELGIIQDNPSSAEAIEAAERGLIAEAKFACETFGPRLVRIMTTALQIRDGWDTPPTEVIGLDARWRKPENPLDSASGDFILKVAQAFPWLTESRVLLEQLGWDENTVERAWADKRRATAASVVQSLRQTPAQPPQPQPSQASATEPVNGATVTA